MSHFAVLVIGDNPNEQLAPYQENNMGDCPEQYLVLDQENRWVNPNAKWDWHVVGGRYSGFLLNKLGSRVDSLRRHELDIEGIRDDAETEARAEMKLITDALGGLPLPDWEEIKLKHGDDIKAARTEWQKLPAVKALLTIEELKYWVVVSNPAERWFNGDVEKFVATRRAEALLTFAVVKDGQWYERGSMGWFGSIGNEKGDAQWDEEFSRLINELGGDTLLTVVDCHI